MLVNPVAKAIPLSPNTLTLMGLVISIVAAVVFAHGIVVLGGALILLSGLFDIFDGAVARSKGNITPFGGVLDSVCDRYADAVIFVGIIYGTLNSNISPDLLLNIPLWLWCTVALIGSYLVSYTRARAEAAGTKDMNIGIAERPERMILLSLGAFGGFIAWAIVLIVILTHITIIQRMLYAKQYLS
ncbi:MAG: CDP-alcohol phosphatidyltransferase family protein [Methanosarcinaceae archaeon]|nr:CDP-alcohol phosphatidyltransferase family protein [Methanosarcinaceae archaeon]